MRWTILILVLWLSSCSNGQIELVPEDQMSIIMTDLILSDYTVRQFPTGMRDSVKIEFMKSLLKVHRLTEAELDTNIYIYSVDFEKYGSLLELVNERLDSLREVKGNQIPPNTILPSKLN